MKTLHALARAATCTALAVAAWAPLTGAAQTLVYSQDFETGAADAAWQGAGTVQTAGTAPGLGQWHLYNGGNQASVLTLTALPAHSSLQLSFDLAVWDTVDGYPGGFPYGDRFVLTADGVTVIDALFGNNTQTGQPIGPGDLLAGPGTYGYGDYWDSTRRVTLTLAHSAPALTLAFAFPSSQGGADEAFGLDNLAISVTPVPEPGAAVLMAGGLLALAGRRWAGRQRRGHQA